MSEYLYLYTRRNDVFISLYNTSRSSGLYKALAPAAPYGKIRKVTPEDISDAISSVNEWIDRNQKRIDGVNKMISLIPTFNNSANEKLELLNETANELDEARSIAEEYIQTRSFLVFIHGMIVDAKNYVSFCNSECENGIYMGIECGDEMGDITAKDIEDEYE